LCNTDRLLVVTGRQVAPPMTAAVYAMVIILHVMW